MAAGSLQIAVPAPIGQAVSRAVQAKYGTVLTVEHGTVSCVLKGNATSAKARDIRQYVEGYIDGYELTCER